jgi:hypothetical protein
MFYGPVNWDNNDVNYILTKNISGIKHNPRYQNFFHYYSVE